jgi:hypothetical protein
MSLIHDMFKRGWLYQATGYTVLISWFLVIFALVFHEIPEANREIFIHLLGIIEGAFVGNLVNHFFGSSNNKPDKDKVETLQP